MLQQTTNAVTVPEPVTHLLLVSGTLWIMVVSEVD
jgi:hypothetical protein